MHEQNNIFSKTEMDQLQKTYVQQVESMAAKPRFGYFSILPSHTAGITDFNRKPCRKGEDGRVTTEQRNFYTGPTSTGVGKKAFFSVPKSIYHGDPYTSSRYIKSSSKTKDSIERQSFKPAKLNKTLMSASYQYVCVKQPPKDAKNYRNQSGAVKTKQPNILTSGQSKIDFTNLKTYKYVESSYDNFKEQNKNDIQESIKKRRGEGPFRSGNPVKQFFRTNVEAFDDHQVKVKTRRNTVSAVNSRSVPHDCAFRPSCRKDVGLNGLFSYPNYMPEGRLNSGKQNQKNLRKVSKQNAEPFKLSKRPESSKPSPSITKIHYTRKLR